MAPWMARAVCSLVLVAAVAASVAFHQASLNTRVTIAVVAGLLLRLLQCFLGPMRRCSRHWLVQRSAMAAYYLPTRAIVTYIAGALVWKSSDSNIYHVGSCIFLIVTASRGTVEMAAYARSDSPPLRWQHFTPMLTICPLLWWLRGTYRLAVFNIFAYIYIVFTMPLIQPAGDRMKKDGEMIQIKGILQQRSDDMRGYRDTCLSYSYCRTLTRLYFGISSTEEGDPYELAKLLPTEYDKVFNIVEVQLAFLHDYYFTNYHSMLSSPPGMLSAAQEVWTVLQDILAYMAVPCLHWLFGGRLFTGWLFGGLTFGAQDLAVLAVEMCIIVLVDWLQRRPILPMYWRTIFNALKKYPEDTGLVYSPTVLEWFVGKTLNCLTPPYWQNKIGQYSLLEDYDRRDHMNTCVSLFKKHMLSYVSYSFIKHHPGEEEPVSLPRSVKRILADELDRVIREDGGQLTRGTKTLERNNVRTEFPWFQDAQNHTDAILMWHIATWYCNIFEKGKNSDHREAATALSGYCAYLVAFLPEILPGKSKNTMRVLQSVLGQARRSMSPEEVERTRPQQVLHKAKDLLGLTRMLKEEKERVIQGCEISGDSLTTFQKGVKLGKLLTDQLRVELRWKVMAEFWAGTILYIAPSDSKENVDVHVDQLAQGGEFLTHLWAWLSIVGIQKQAREEQIGLQREVDALEIA
ncbi:hypothetical protein GQ55_1G106800 [Panicum hallii var. hallii]|uniref:DUF4220 domain-containing protein n=1 Tax=Panicum hallii var. hallii TaxID=1504633 RepID=A0A2T7F4E2_9POAL|nr:hypothetical protein GQ55_1G106800 [Panicum hallii var. hallii]